jgi:hypothetical protein
MTKNPLPPVPVSAPAQRPRVSVDPDVVELRCRLFESDFASRLGRDPMAAGLALYRTILSGDPVDPTAFVAFCECWPPTTAARTRRGADSSPATAPANRTLPTQAPTAPALPAERPITSLGHAEYEALVEQRKNRLQPKRRAARGKGREE